MKLFIALFAMFSIGMTLSAQEHQKISELKVTKKNFATVEALTNSGTFRYHIDNSGDRDVAEAMQTMFDELSALKDVSATITFSPGTYYLNSPVRLKMASVKLVGNGHGGVDIHGANLESGTIFLLGKGCAPHCITFDYAGRSESFPAKETPWKNQNLKVELDGISFVGYNNTGVNTADGYSRFRNDSPNFRGLHWYPSKDRYDNVEKEGQKAIYLPKAPSLKDGGLAKCELIRVTGCYFTDLYVAIDVADSDVSYINKNWFGQLTYAIRVHNNAQGMMVSENLFADLETAVSVGSPIFSTFNNNTFAYVSKCFEFRNIKNSTITDNALYNWSISTGAAAFGSFCHVKSSSDLIVSDNTMTQQLDSRKKSRTVDEKPNGESFIQFDNSQRLMFTDNIINTIITQTVVRLNNCSNSVVTDNIITFGKGGNGVAQTGNCKNNFYRTIKPSDSEPFDQYKY